MSGLEKALFNLKVWKQHSVSLKLVPSRAADVLRQLFNFEIEVDNLLISFTVYVETIKQTGRKSRQRFSH